MAIVGRKRDTSHLALQPHNRVAHLTGHESVLKFSKNLHP